MSDVIVLWILLCILCNVNSDWTCAVWTIDDSCREDILCLDYSYFVVSSPRVNYCELYLLCWPDCRGGGCDRPNKSLN